MLDISLDFILYLLLMALVTYLVRMLPLVFFRRKIHSQRLRSFLYYAPYSVLTAMTFPAIFYSTSSIVSAVFGTAVALVLAFMRKSLVTVAASAALAVLFCELVLPYIPFLS